MIALTGQRSTLRRLRQPANDVVAEHGAGNGCLSGGRRVSSSGDWDLGNPAFAISHGSRDTTALTPELNIASLACCCSFHLSDPGKPLDPRTLLRVPPGCAGDTTERLAAHFASRSSHSRRELSPPYGRPTGQRPDPDGVTAFRTHESRPGWVLSVAREQRCSSRLERVPNRRPPHSQRPVPALRHNNPSRGALHHEASTRVQAIHPSGLPLACDPRMERERLGLFPELRTPPTSGRATHVEEGTGHRARTWNNTHATSDEPPTSCSLVSCDLASHRAFQGGRHHARHAAREIRAGPAPDPIAGSRATVGTGGSRLKRSWRRGSPLRVSEGQSDRDCSVGDTSSMSRRSCEGSVSVPTARWVPRSRAARARRSKMGDGCSQHGELFRCACTCVLVG